jgi:hypothetical protein
VRAETPVGNIASNRKKLAALGLDMVHGPLRVGKRGS